MCDCGIHATFKTSQAVHSKKGPRLKCVRCSLLCMGKISKGTSAFEIYAWRLVDSNEDMVACAEVKILRGYYGPADIFIPFSKDGKHRIDLVIQIDGQHHFEQHRQIAARSKKQSEQQHQQDQSNSLQDVQRADADFDDRCWQLNLRLLRLHYKDSAAYAQLIQQAWQRCLTSPEIRFRMYSASYTSKPARSEPFGTPPHDEAGKMNHKRKWA